MLRLGTSSRRTTAVPAAAGVLAASLVACTPPWYRLLVVTVEGRFLADGACTAATRGDVTGRLRLPAGGVYLHSDNLPRPLPPTTLVLQCGHADPTGRPSRLTFVIATPDPARGVAPGTYWVLPDDAPPAAHAAPGAATFLATLSPSPAAPYPVRHYGAAGGVLVLSAVGRAPDGGVRVTGRFRVRAHRVVRSG